MPFFCIYLKKRYMENLMKEKIRYIFVLLAVLVILGVSRQLGRLLTSSTQNTVQYCVVLDPGHGGGDPGKVGVNGEKEKDLNLKIACEVQKLLTDAGIRVVMTRSEDEALDGKLEDMKKRVALINDTAPNLVVSIHQNSYTDSSVKGAQVFYHTSSEQGRELALVMQEELYRLDEENRRQAKGNDTYYMLRNTKVPSIIVECGFLSNSEEAALLCTEEYQIKLAEVICAGIIKGLDKL